MKDGSDGLIETHDIDASDLSLETQGTVASD